MKKISEIQAEIVAEFNFFTDWTEKYEYLIDMGKSIPKMKKESKTNTNLIKGCQSKVWLDACLKDGKVMYSADSDAIITKGLIGLLLRVFSTQTPQKIIDASLSFVDEIGLKEHLSPTRANGLMAFIKQIKLYAIGYNDKNLIS